VARRSRKSSMVTVVITAELHGNSQLSHLMERSRFRRRAVRGRSLGPVENKHQAKHHGHYHDVEPGYAVSMSAGN
jgi:hypothetical protein